MAAMFDGRIEMNNMLHVGRVISGSIVVGEFVRACGVHPDTVIKSQLSGNIGGFGLYELTGPQGENALVSATMESYSR